MAPANSGSIFSAMMASAVIRVPWGGSAGVVDGVAG